MSIIFQCIIGIIIFVISVFVLFNMYVPLFWLPYVIYGILKGKYKFSAISCCLVAPITWFAILGIIIGILGAFSFTRNICEYVIHSQGALYGFGVAAWIVIMNCNSQSAKNEFKELLSRYERNCYEKDIF